MYYKDRVEAGRKLAAQLEAYRSKNTVVVALSESSVVVAREIAKHLHAGLLLYMIRNIVLPGETAAIAAISSTGTFSFNDSLSSGEISDISSEFRNFIEQEKIGKIHDMNVLLSGSGEIDKSRLRHHYIILVADALPDGFSLTMINEYLKTVSTKKIVVAVPVAGIEAIDKMHRVADELHVGGVTDNFLSIDHYYDENEKPDFDEVMKIIDSFSLDWQSAQDRQHAREHHLGKRRRSTVLFRPRTA